MLTTFTYSIINEGNYLIDTFGGLLNRFLTVFAYICITFSSSAAIAADDFFDLMGSALESVGLQINQYQPAKTVFLETPRISNIGFNDYIDFSFIDLDGQGVKVELVLRVAPEKLVPVEGPLSRLMQKSATASVFNELEASLRIIESLVVANVIAQPELGMMQVALQIPKHKTIEVVQGLLTTLLEGRQLVHAHALDAAALGDPCAPSFSSKPSVH
jgi:hypothetical protein